MLYNQCKLLYKKEVYDIMAKIIRVDNGIVTVGMENGTFKEVPQEILDFAPVVGTNVEVYQKEDRIIISKKNVFESTNGKKLVNKTAYGLLALFLGGIGVHKFYAGKTLQGVLYLIFFWSFIPALIAFIEGILALTKNADENGNILV